ncbi:RNA polymerase sigma factor [Agrilutibacter solisilvae]|uniref:Sigma-70 family RNA polymerase sigma factor n=1 Tax=Agrilutibacter solisilvae TaxID=2763317 RepID=A0A975ASB3_9GAMM|nr:sigma-70 family RNA polymerase sigma factor [Lysobacter solisilvae]QSX77889.1 sigma-70 family RNA polymerase sigma factor [Lysobacter solisilvae]
MTPFPPRMPPPVRALLQVGTCKSKPAPLSRGRGHGIRAWRFDPILRAIPLDSAIHTRRGLTFEQDKPRPPSRTGRRRGAQDFLRLPSSARAGNVFRSSTTGIVALNVPTHPSVLPPAQQHPSDAGPASAPATEKPTASKQGRSGVTAQADLLFERTWRAAYPALRHRAQRLAEGRSDRADDLLAGAAVKALQFMRRAPQKLTDPEVFLFVVLKHVFLDTVRRCARHNRVFDASTDPELDAESAPSGGDRTAEQWSERREQLGRVDGVLRRLAPDQQRLFAWRFIDDLPYAAIAQRLGISEALARKRVQLLRARLLAGLDNGFTDRRLQRLNRSTRDACRAPRRKQCKHLPASSSHRQDPTTTRSRT